jgi:WD40 repeat protein
VLDHLDPNAVAVEVLRRAFGARDLPVEIAAVAAARHTLAQVPPEERTPIRLLATARGARTDRPAPGPMSAHWRWAWADLRRDPMSVVIVGHRGVVTAAAAVRVPDGRTLLATGGSDRTVRLWDPTSGQQVGPMIRAHAGAVLGLAAMRHADAAVLASFGSDGAVRLWSPVTGEEITALDGVHFTALCAMVLGGEPRFVTGDREGGVRFWHPDGSAAGELAGGPAVAVTAICPVPYGDRILVARGDRDGGVRLWDPDRPTAPMAELTPDLVGRVTGLCAVVGPDGATVLAATSRASTVVRWEVTSGERLWDPEDGVPLRSRRSRHTDGLNAVTGLGPDGRTLATASNDASIRLWDALTGAPVSAPLTGHHGPVRALASLALPDGRSVLASGGDDATVRLWAPPTARPDREPDRAAGPVTALAVAGDGLVTVTSDRTVRLRTGSRGSDDAVHAVDFPITAVAALTGPDGSPLVAIGGDEGHVWIWSPGSDVSATRPLRGHTDRVVALQAWVGPDGRQLLVSGSDDGTVRLWDAVTGACIDELMARHPGGVVAIAAGVTADGACVIASVGRNDPIRLWWPDGARPAGSVAAIHRAGRPLALIRLGDERLMLATGGEDGAVRLRDPATGRADGLPLIGHTRPVTALVALERPDHEVLLATACGDATIRLWTPDETAPLDTIRLDRPPRALASRGARLVIGYEFGIVAIDLNGS